MLMVVWVVMWHTPWRIYQDMFPCRTTFTIKRCIISLTRVVYTQRAAMYNVFYFRTYKIRGHLNIQISIWFQSIWWFHDFISIAKKCIFIDYLCINNAPHAENINDVRSFIIHRGGISECLDFTFNVLNRLL